MKTIKQIAEEIGVSKQSVQKRISREPLYTQLSACIQLVHSTKYIDENGEKLIKSAFEKNVSIDKDVDVSIDMGIDKEDLSIDKSIDKNVASIDKDQSSYIADAVIEMLKEELESKNRLIEQLQKELSEERRYIREQSDKLIVLTDTAQKLHAGTIQQQLIKEQKPEKTKKISFFGFFKKNKEKEMF